MVGLGIKGTIIIKMVNTSTPLNWDWIVLNERSLNFAAFIRSNIVTTGSVKSLQKICNFLLKVCVWRLLNPNRHSCSVWSIHLGRSRLEYPRTRRKAVVLLPVKSRLDRRLDKTIGQKNIYTFQIMRSHLDQVIVVYEKNFRVLG